MCEPVRPLILAEITLSITRNYVVTLSAAVLFLLFGIIYLYESLVATTAANADIPMSIVGGVKGVGAEDVI